MHHPRATLGIAILFCALGAPVHAQSDISETVDGAIALPAQDARIADLLERMTLEEKIGQLTQFSNGAATGPDNTEIDHAALAARAGLGSVLNLVGAPAVNELQRAAVEQSRLGIPILFALDVIHGYRTVYPIPLAMAATWNPDLAERCARMAAVEATAEGIRWTFAPMVDLARDARWGRITEGAGEDPFLGAAFGAAYVRGFQGADLASPDAMVACPKHLAGYGASVGGRDYDAAEISERVLREIYLPPFKAAIDAGAGTVMSAFQTVNSVPASASRFLLTDILRDEWGFQGFVVSDWTSIAELIPHGIALTGADAALKAFDAGVDMDMVSNLYASQLPDLVRDKRITTAAIDESVARILRIKLALGLFENPYTDESLSPGVLLTPAHRALAREAAEQSLILLKNDAVGGRPLLPLRQDQRIALIGPLADAPSDMLGSWAGRGKAEDAISVLAAMRDRFSDRVTYAKGVDLQDESENNLAEALRIAAESDVIIAAVGETRRMSGEASSRAELDLPGRQHELIRALVGTGKPVVVVVFAGRPLALPWEAEHIPAILLAWFPGVEAGLAVVRTLCGDADPCGRLTVSVPRAVGQVPLYYNALNTGRPAEGRPPGTGFFMGYKDQLPTPLYPFGFGLTYTTFKYAPTTVDATSISTDALRTGGTITVSTTITNTGDRLGTEVAQLYIRQRGTSVARPVRELKGFRRITLNPGESQPVMFTLTHDDLAFWGIDMVLDVEPGELAVWIAPHAEAGDPALVSISIR